MNKLMSSLLIAVLASGCFSTNLVHVHDCNPRLKIKSFSENPFFAKIEYDYSSITNFNESKVHAVLELSHFHKLFYDPAPSNEVIIELYKMNPEFTYYTHRFREDPYIERKNGYLKILCADSVGTYRLVFLD
jgi:hypothetical protein